MARRRVLDVGDMSADVGLHVAVFEDAVAQRVEGAALEHEVVGIAEQLLAREVAVDEAHVLGVPGQILAVELGVDDGDVLALPEGVLRDDVGIAQRDVLAVLEDIFRVAAQTVDLDVLREHEGIGAVVQLQVAGTHVATAPEGLVGIVDDDILQVEVVHLAEHLRPVDARVAHVHVVAVPEGRAGADVKLAAVDPEAVDMPEGILAPEAAVLCLDVATLLDGALAVADGHLFQSHVVLLEERTLALEMLILNDFHN